jgi:hypothetical protein
MPRLHEKVALITGGESGIYLASSDSSFVTGSTLVADG